MNFVGPSIIVLTLSIKNNFDLLFPQLQDLLLKKFNFVHEQSNCVRLRSYETFEAVVALCSPYFYPQHLTSIPNKIDKLIFNYNQVVNFHNKVTASNMYLSVTSVVEFCGHESTESRF